MMWFDSLCYQDNYPWKLPKAQVKTENKIRNFWHIQSMNWCDMFTNVTQSYEECTVKRTVSLQKNWATETHLGNCPIPLLYLKGCYSVCWKTQWLGLAQSWVAQINRKPVLGMKHRCVQVPKRRDCTPTPQCHASLVGCKYLQIVAQPGAAVPTGRQGGSCCFDMRLGV